MQTSVRACLIAVVVASSSCSSDCVPASGGVVVNVAGVTSCDRVTVSASDGANQYPLEATGSNSADGGIACQFQGLNGHPGTFAVQVSIDGVPMGSQPVSLEKIDECNVSAKLLSFDVSAS